MSETLPVTENGIDIGWSESVATADLRFVKKDGRLILQQRFVIRTSNSYSNEWREVPVHNEEGK